MPLGFLASYMRHPHRAPEQVRTPLLLVHPSRDDWTPVDLSVRVLARSAGPTRLVMLRECGHFPIEEPGLSDLLDAVADLAESLARRVHQGP